MDNRISTVVAIQALKALKDSPHEVYFVFSVQEEVGLRGSATAAYGLDPDLGLAVDVTRTGDTPRTSKMEVALDKGPAVKVRDSSFIADPRVVDWMAATAKAAEIPYQMEVLEAGGTDGRSIQLARAGVPPFDSMPVYSYPLRNGFAGRCRECDPLARRTAEPRCEVRLR